MKNKEKLLFIYTDLSSFVKGDLDILREKYQVTTYRFHTHKSYKLILSLLRQFLFLLFHIWKFRKVYIWFGDYHSFLPVLFAKMTGKKSYLVIGGYDVCRIKSLNYGSFKNPLRGFMTLFSMKYCTLNLCVSKNVQRKVRWIAPKAHTIIIFNSVNFRPSDQHIAKENIILTVGNINSYQRILIKGIDRFIHTACQLPQFQFIIVGMTSELLKQHNYDIPANLQVYKFLPHEQLVGFYQKAKIYMQLSRSESFCLTLAEAMFYNCIPIVTNVGGMPEVIGSQDLVINENKLDGLLPKIENIILSENNAHEQHERIKNYFTQSAREKQLLSKL